MNLMMIERAEEVELVEMNEPTTEETNLTMIERAEEVEMRGETVRRKLNIVVEVVAHTQPRSHLPLPLSMAVVFVPILQPLFLFSGDLRA